jgi:hypothetical protein
VLAGEVPEEWQREAVDGSGRRPELAGDGGLPAVDGADGVDLTSVTSCAEDDLWMDSCLVWLQGARGAVVGVASLRRRSSTAVAFSARRGKQSGCDG